jgi:hypothetical protein
VTAPAGPIAGGAPPRRALIIACGALVRKIQAVLGQSRLRTIDLRALPAGLHNRPQEIAPAVARLLAETAGTYEKIFVAYGDCGTGGELDRVLAVHGAERLLGAHCYQFFSGLEAFEARADRDFTSFFLTDFLTRQFDALVVRGLGLDRHPELRDVYFAHYERVVYLSQAPTDTLVDKARAAARFLDLDFEHRPVGYGDLGACLETHFPRARQVPPVGRTTSTVNAAMEEMCPAVTVA